MPSCTGHAHSMHSVTYTPVARTVSQHSSGATGWLHVWHTGVDDPASERPVKASIFISKS